MVDSAESDMCPWLHTGVGGESGAMSMPPPGGGVTRTLYAVGSHCRPVVGSFGPGTSGEKRAVVLARAPGRRTTRTAVSPGRKADSTRVGSTRPVLPRRRRPARPETKHAVVDRFRSLSA